VEKQKKIKSECIGNFQDEEPTKIQEKPNLINSEKQVKLNSEGKNSTF
jgi:hypothetical protein